MTPDARAELIARLRVERYSASATRLCAEAADALEADAKEIERLDSAWNALVAENDKLRKDAARWHTEALAWRNGCTGKHGSQSACVNVAAIDAALAQGTEQK